MDPGRTGGAVQQQGGIDQIAGASADAGVPGGPDRERIGIRSATAERRGRIGAAEHGRGLVRKTDIAFETQHGPADLPVIAEIGAYPEGLRR